MSGDGHMVGTQVATEWPQEDHKKTWFKFRIAPEIAKRVEKLRAFGIKFNLSIIARKAVINELTRIVRDNKDFLVDAFIQDAYEDLKQKGENHYSIIEKLELHSELLSAALHNHLSIKISVAEVKRRVKFLSHLIIRSTNNEKIDEKEMDAVEELISVSSIEEDGFVGDSDE